MLISRCLSMYIAVLLLACGMFASSAIAAAGSAVVIKQGDKGAWHLKADRLPLADVLRELERVSGVKVHGENSVSERVLADYDYVSLDSLIKAILKPYNHALMSDRNKQGKYVISSVWVLARFDPARAGELIDARPAAKQRLVTERPAMQVPVSPSEPYDENSPLGRLLAQLKNNPEAVGDTAKEKILTAALLAGAPAGYAVPPLVNMAVSQNKDVVNAAVEALQVHGALVPGDAIAEAIDKQSVAQSRLRLLMAGFAIPKADLAYITLNDPEPTMRLEALYQLFAGGPNPTYTSVLNKALKDKSPFVRASAFDIQKR